MNFLQKLNRAIETNNSFLCVGLDPDYSKLPSHLKNLQYPLFEFNKQIIDSTHDLVCGYKPNSAFYEAWGHEGIYQLKLTFDYLHQKYPHIPTILDAKRADIGNTNLGYIQFAFEYLGVDSITLNPYLGKEAMQPFLSYKNRGLFFLCKSSNPGSGEFQDITIGERKLYQIIAQQVSQNWNQNNNCLLVVGATYPRELADIRQLLPNMTFLIPGVGSQGGDIQQTVNAAKNSDGKGFIINSSRNIIFASNEKDFAQAARQRAIEVRDSINSCL